MYGGSLRELKKLDLFDLGVMLTIAATDGLDMVSEELLGKLTVYKGHCCLLHALMRQDANSEYYEKSNLRTTLLTARRILSRISPTAQEFIC